MQATAAKSRSPRQRREICRSFTCISPWAILFRLFNGGKSRIDDDTERKIEDFSEIAGNERVGYGLIYLVRSEVKKMIELRGRIESVLQQLETEIDDNQLNAEEHNQSLRMDELEAELEDEFDRLEPRIFDAELQNEGEESLIGGGGGVCAVELERKLHQVLEWRQEERIKELESNLEDALQQLEEKERELSFLYTFPPSNFIHPL